MLEKISMISLVGGALVAIASLVGTGYSIACFEQMMKIAKEKAAKAADAKVKDENILAPWLRAVSYLALATIAAWACISFNNTVMCIILAILFIVGIVLVANATKGGEKLAAYMAGGLGAPYAVGVALNVFKVFYYGHWDFEMSWPQLWWLVAIPVFFAGLSLVYRLAAGLDWRPPVGVVAIPLVILGIFTGIWNYSKTNSTSEEAIAVAEETTVSEAETEAAEAEKTSDEGGVILTDSKTEKVTLSAMLSKGRPTAEEMNIQAEYGEDAYPVAKTAEESSSTVEELKLTSEILDRFEALIPWEFNWNSLGIKKDGTLSHVDQSAKDHGYVNYNISSALSTAFDSKKNDDEGLSKELLEEFSNTIFTSVMMRGIGNVKVLDKRLREVYGFFDKFIVEDRKAYAKDEEEFWKLMEEDKILDDGYTIDCSFDDTPGLTYAEIPGNGGDGIDHWTTPAYEGDEIIVTPEYHQYATKLAALIFSTLSYEGVKDRTTKLKSVLDNRSDGGFARGQFTDLPERQVNAPMLLFTYRDKDGSIAGDFFGIDYWDKNFEIPGGTTTGKVVVHKNPKKEVTPTLTKKKVTPTPTPKPTAKPTATPTKAPKPTQTPKPTSAPKPTTTPTKPPKPNPEPTTTPKHPENDPQYKPENVDIAGKNVGEELNLFNINVPQIWSNDVPEAQGGNQSEYTQAIVSGDWTPSGSENNYTPEPGTVETDVVIIDENGNGHTGSRTWETDDGTGAPVADGDYVDEATGEEAHADHAEARTEEATDVVMDDHVASGNETEGNTAENNVVVQESF